MGQLNFMTGLEFGTLSFNGVFEFLCLDLHSSTFYIYAKMVMHIKTLIRDQPTMYTLPADQDHCISRRTHNFPFTPQPQMVCNVAIKPYNTYSYEGCPRHSKYLWSVRQWNTFLLQSPTFFFFLLIFP